MPGDGFTLWPDIAPATFLTPIGSPAAVSSALGFTITLASFISTLAQQSTDYQVWSGPGGSGTLLWQSLADSNLLVKIVPAGAVPAGAAYLRVRMSSTTGKNSAWSADKALAVS